MNNIYKKNKRKAGRNKIRYDGYETNLLETLKRKILVIEIKLWLALEQQMFVVLQKNRIRK